MPSARLGCMAAPEMTISECHDLPFLVLQILGNSAVVNRLVGHLQICQDCCDDFGLPPSSIPVGDSPQHHQPSEWEQIALSNPLDLH